MRSPRLGRSIQAPSTRQSGRRPCPRGRTKRMAGGFRPCTCGAQPVRTGVFSFAAIQMLLEGSPTSPASSPRSHVDTELPRANTRGVRRCTTAPSSLTFCESECDSPTGFTGAKRQGRLGIATPKRARSSGDSHLCRITLLAVREGRPAEPVWVDLHHEAGIGSEHPIPVDRSAAKIA